MSLRAGKSNNTFWRRWVAALCLIVWAVAMAACAADCGAGEKKASCCHKKSAARFPEKAFCLHIQPIEKIQPACESARPTLELNPDFAEIQAAIFELQSPAASLSRSARIDFVFAPEVSLGAAFRSLAPPVRL